MIKARRGTLRVPEYDPFFADHLPPVPDLLQRLSWEHRQIEKLWEDLQRAHRWVGVAPAARMGTESQADVAHMLVQALSDHEEGERTALYPAAQKVMTPEWVDGATAEHAELRDMLDEIEGADPADEAVFEVLERVMSRMLAHITEEEKIVFPVMRFASPKEDLATSTDKDYLGLPPGRPMIPVAPTQRQLALGTGRRAAQRQVALGPGQSPAEGETDGHGHAQAEVAGEGDARAEPAGGAADETEIDLRDGGGGEALGRGAKGGAEAGGTAKTKTRTKRLLRRR